MVARASVRVVAVELQPQQVLQPVQVQVRLLARQLPTQVALLVLPPLVWVLMRLAGAAQPLLLDSEAPALRWPETAQPLLT